LSASTIVLKGCAERICKEPASCELTFSINDFVNEGEGRRRLAKSVCGRHGINRPGATSATAHSRSRAAIDPARPGSGRSQGTAIPAVPGHVPTLARVLCRPAMRPRPPGSSLAEFNGRLNYRAGQATTGNDGVGQRLVRDQGLR
jgi:hypothetical protein